MDKNPEKVDIKDLANAIRFLSMDAVQKANSGHPGMPMGMADVATVLFTQFLKFDPTDPNWPDRDRFILSAGHGSMLLYSLMYLTGFKDIDIEQIKNFRQLGSLTAGHPEFGLASAIETTTGPLGQGLGNGVGMALAEELLSSRFGEELVNHYTYVLAGDGCLMEGLSHEAISIAGHLKLKKLIVLFDDNNISIDGPTSLAVSDNQLLRFEASGWDTFQADGHDYESISKAIKNARVSDRPSLIACRTIIGFGSPNLAGTSKTHGAPLGVDEIEKTRIELGWKHPPFKIPNEILLEWKQPGIKGANSRQQWIEKLDKMPSDKRIDFNRMISGDLPEGWRRGIDKVIGLALSEAPKIATRKASELVINELAHSIPELVGGSADLTGSNNTKVDSQKPIQKNDFSGSYVYWGVREHGMSAALNGMALHGGVIPYGGTFLVFTDYCRPSIRLSALMGLRVIYIMTHDSIGLGEDGPTHQPIEHLASLRSIPNLLVMRPADLVETAECWSIALDQKSRPSLLALSRQSLPSVRMEKAKENLCLKGGYIISDSAGDRQATILTSGSEVSLALSAQEILKNEGIQVSVISIPCWELFAEQDQLYQKKVLGECPRVSVEASVSFGWERYTGNSGSIVGMDGFGASAPGADLYNHFSITADSVVAAVKTKL